MRSLKIVLGPAREIDESGRNGFTLGANHTETRQMADDGLTTIESPHDVKTTIDRLEAAAKAKGLTIFARIDHGVGAAAAGLQLRPTELLIFGNAKGGTPLMQEQQTTGLDLPLKTLAWQDSAGKTWLT
jgi:uncharacterized protein (DUF302 family)